MSPWSRRFRLLALLVLGSSSLGLAGAQEAAILRVGPEPARGIPYLRANALGGFRGAYVVGPRDFQLASSEQMTAGGPDPEGSPPEPGSAKVFYTRAPLVLPQEWSGMRCGSLRLLTVTGQEDFTLCYPDAQGWTLFFQFPRPGESILLETSPLAEGERRPSAQAVPAALPGTAAEPPPWACSFAESFVRRFQILLGFVDASREPPFPAILQLGR